MPPYQHHQRVQFRDTDAAGIAHFSMFVVWMEQAEHAAIRSLGMSVMHARDGEPTVSWPRVSVHCDYQRPARFEDELVIDVIVSKLSEKSVTYGFGFSRDETSLAVGRLTTVCCQQDDTTGAWHSIPIPPDIRTRLQRLS